MWSSAQSFIGRWEEPNGPGHPIRELTAHGHRSFELCTHQGQAGLDGVFANPHFCLKLSIFKMPQLMGHSQWLGWGTGVLPALGSRKPLPLHRRNPSGAWHLGGDLSFWCLWTQHSFDWQTSGCWVAEQVFCCSMDQGANKSPKHQICPPSPFYFITSKMF